MHAKCKRQRYDGCMASITIRNVPWSVHSVLAERAARHGVSLQTYVLRELIEMSEKPDLDQWVAMVNEAVESHGTRIDPDLVVEDLRQMRSGAGR